MSAGQFGDDRSDYHQESQTLECDLARDTLVGAVANNDDRIFGTLARESPFLAIVAWKLAVRFFVICMQMASAFFLR